MRLVFLGGAILLLLGTSVRAETPSSSSTDAEQASAVALLQDMIHAMRDEDFAGTYVHLRGDHIDTMQLTHVVNDKGEQEQLKAMNGEPRDVIRTNDQCECIWPSRHKIVFGDFPGISARLSGRRFGKPEHLTENYRIVSLGPARVAGHDCHLIGLVPKDALRYGYKLCIGDRKHLMLRMSIYNEHGMPIEHNFFTEVHMLKDKPVLKMDRPGALPSGFTMVRVQSVGHGKPVSAGKGWVVSPLPPGYEEKSRVWRHNPVTDHRFEHIVLSDGLSTASVFIEDVPSDKPPRNLASLGGMNMSVRRVGDMRITVIGDMPPKTVDMLCKNTHRIPGSSANEDDPAAIAPKDRH